MTFIGFSSRKVGKITLKNAKDVTAVTAVIREPILNVKVKTYELTKKQIAAGEFSIPAIDTGDVYTKNQKKYDKKNAFPEELELKVTVRYNSAKGEKKLEYTVKDRQEQGWGMMYWDDKEEKSDWTYPGYFRFSTYESRVPVSLVVDAPEKARTDQKKVVISVSLSIGGRKIPSKDCSVREEHEDVTGAKNKKTRYYYARVFVKRPKWAPKHGTIHQVVVQQLSDGTVWTTEQDTKY